MTTRLDIVCCEICGVTVQMQMYPDGPALSHLVDQIVCLDGVIRAVWERHLPAACRKARTEHWQRLINVGMLGVAGGP